MGLRDRLLFRLPAGSIRAGQQGSRQRQRLKIHSGRSSIEPPALIAA